MWTDSKYDATTYGTKLLKKIIGNNEFSYPKSINAVKDILLIFLSNDEDNVVSTFLAAVELPIMLS